MNSLILISLSYEYARVEKPSETPTLTATVTPTS